MNVLRLALVGSALAAVAIASAQILPRKQYALFTDYGASTGNYGCIHRVNAYNGADLGIFGVGIVNRPQAIAVQPSTGVAYVVDRYGLKRFDAATGQYLGSLGSAVSAEKGLESIRFNSAGALFAVVKQDAKTKYRLYQLNPATGATMAVSGVMPGVSDRKMALSFRPDGTLEVTRMYFNGTDVYTSDEGTYVNRFAPNLTSVGTNFYPQSTNSFFETFRLSNDGYVRWTYTDTNSHFYYNLVFQGGTGDLGGATSTNNVLVSQWGHPMFAEGVAKRVYLYVPNGSNSSMVELDSTPGGPYPVVQFHISMTNVEWLTDMAIFYR